MGTYRRLSRHSRALLVPLAVACVPFGAAYASPAAPVAAQAAADSVPNPAPVERRLRLRHHWTREQLDVVYRIGDDYQPAAMEAINHFMRDWRCEKTFVIDPKLIDRLHALQEAVGGRIIRVISAYRSEGYNASLLLAGRTVDPNSQHMQGRAADVFVPGLHADKVRAAAETAGIGGVGYYPFSGPRFVHVDTGPERHWTETDPSVRRQLGLKAPRRGAIKLDCAMTMEQALQDPLAAKQLTALPADAVVEPANSLPTAAISAVASADGVCEAALPFAPLQVMVMQGPPPSTPQAVAGER